MCPVTEKLRGPETDGKLVLRLEERVAGAQHQTHLAPTGVALTTDMAGESNGCWASNIPQEPNESPKRAEILQNIALYLMVREGGIPFSYRSDRMVQC